MRATATFSVLMLLLAGCTHTARPLLICPATCRSSADDWTKLRECLFKVDGVYWLTDANGSAVESYRAGHDGGHLPVRTSRAEPAHISTPVILPRGANRITLHLRRGSTEQSFDLDSAKKERRGEYDILVIE
jgi:hypothetical protein